MSIRAHIIVKDSIGMMDVSWIVNALMHRVDSTDVRRCKLLQVLSGLGPKYDDFM